METKMRVKLYSKNTIPELLSDRLVEQVTEFAKGPITKHDGPLSLELNLRDKEDCEKAIEYIGKLALQVPLEVPGEKKAKVKKLDKDLSDDKPLEDLKDKIVASCKTQEEVITSLREYNFKFVTYQHLMDITVDSPDMLSIPSKYNEYQFMLRQIKEAKNPVNDKWDTRLIFAIKIRGERVEKIPIFLWGKKDMVITKLKWKEESPVNFKKKEKLFNFPEFMDLDMRSKWRAEDRKFNLHVEAGGNKEDFKFSPFYIKWKPWVKIPKV